MDDHTSALIQSPPLTPTDGKESLSIEQSKPDGDLLAYIRLLAKEHPFSRDINLDETRGIVPLQEVWPKMKGWEPETRALLRYIHKIVSSVPVVKPFSGTFLRVSVSASPLMPLFLPVPHEAIAVASIDTAPEYGVERRCAVLHTEEAPDLKEMGISAGVMIVCQPISPMFNRYTDNRPQGLGSGQVYGDRNRDPLRSGDDPPDYKPIIEDMSVVRFKELFPGLVGEYNELYPQHPIPEPPSSSDEKKGEVGGGIEAVEEGAEALLLAEETAKLLRERREAEERARHRAHFEREERERRERLERMRRQEELRIEEARRVEERTQEYKREEQIHHEEVSVIEEKAFLAAEAMAAEAEIANTENEPAENALASERMAGVVEGGGGIPEPERPGDTIAEPLASEVGTVAEGAAEAAIGAGGPERPEIPGGEVPTKAPTEVPVENPATEIPAESPTEAPEQTPRETPEKGPAEVPTEKPAEGTPEALNEIRETKAELTAEGGTEPLAEGRADVPEQAVGEVPEQAVGEVPEQAVERYSEVSGETTERGSEITQEATEGASQESTLEAREAAVNEPADRAALETPREGSGEAGELYVEDTSEEDSKKEAERSAEVGREEAKQAVEDSFKEVGRVSEESAESESVAVAEASERQGAAARERVAETPDELRSEISERQAQLTEEARGEALAESLHQKGPAVNEPADRAALDIPREGSGEAREASFEAASFHHPTAETGHEFAREATKEHIKESMKMDARPQGTYEARTEPRHVEASEPVGTSSDRYAELAKEGVPATRMSGREERGLEAAGGQTERPPPATAPQPTDKYVELQTSNNHEALPGHGGVLREAVVHHAAEKATGLKSATSLAATRRGVGQKARPDTRRGVQARKDGIKPSRQPLRQSAKQPTGEARARLSAVPSSPLSAPLSVSVSTSSRKKPIAAPPTKKTVMPLKKGHVSEQKVAMPVKERRVLNVQETRSGSTRQRTTVQPLMQKGKDLRGNASAKLGPVKLAPPKSAKMSAKTSKANLRRTVKITEPAPTVS